MLILKCTQKAAREFGVQRSKLPLLSESDDPTLLGAWFVNAVKFGRRKALIFMNADTLYSFLIPYRKKDLADLHGLFVEAMFRNFLAEALPLAGIERVMNDYHDGVTLARTDDRRVLGVMNDAVFNYQTLIQLAGDDLAQVDIRRIARNVNRIVQWKHDGAPPIEVMQERLGRA